MLAPSTDVVPRKSIYDFTMYILAGLLLLGLICNALVTPLDQKWFMKPKEVAVLQERTASTDGSTQYSSYGIAKGGLDMKALLFWSVVIIPLGWASGKLS